MDNKHPALCQRCQHEVSVFRAAGHPDDGRLFVCGQMMEALRGEIPMYSCGFYKPKPCPAVIEA